MTDQPPLSLKKRPVATIKSIAKQLDLSPSTVSRALRRDSSVTDQTTEKVLKFAQSVGYSPDMRGVNLRTGKTNTLCAILASNPTIEFGDPATMHLIQGLIAGVEGSRFKLVIQPVGSQQEQIDTLREAVETNRFDGYIIDHTLPMDRRVKYLLESDVPFVTFGRTELFTEHAYFDVDNQDAAEVATTELIRRGHKRIALIDPPDTYLFSGQRRAGYEAALRQAHIGLDNQLVIETDINSVTVHGAINTLMQLEYPPTAFVTSNEVATIAAVHACRELDLNMNDLEFISRDGTRFFDYFEQRISSCYFPILEAGNILVDMLISAIGGAPVSTLQRLEAVNLIKR